MSCIFYYLQISREGDVDLLPVGSDPVQQQRVVHGTVPRCLKSVECSGRRDTLYHVSEAQSIIKIKAKSMKRMKIIKRKYWGEKL